MKNWQASALTLYLPNMNKTSKSENSRNGKQEQVRQSQAKCEEIFLGLDVHSDHIRVVRQIEEGNCQPAQRFSWERIESFCQKQTQISKKVYAVYEAGAFGYGLYRKLKAIGVECYVIAPCNLDPDQRRVQTDKTEARELSQKLWRYVRGNGKAMRVVHVPSETQEAERTQGRHRQYLRRELQSAVAHGRGLLLSAGFRLVGPWWTELRWKELSPSLGPELRSVLEDCRQIILGYVKIIGPVEEKLKASAPAQLPLAMGQLTYVLLMREIHDWDRFQNRRQVGSFLGLCGGVSSSSRSHYDLGITKCGSPQLRALLVELAWRMVRYQPHYRGVQKWGHILRDRRVHRKLRKRAIVALARQLAVDIWKWQTGRATAEQLGWVLIQH